MPRPTSFDHVLSKGDAGMPHQTLFDRVCCPKVMFACHARRPSSFCASQRQDGMPRPTSFDCVRFSKAVMACHA